MLSGPRHTKPIGAANTRESPNMATKARTARKKAVKPVKMWGRWSDTLPHEGFEYRNLVLFPDEKEARHWAVLNYPLDYDHVDQFLITPAHKGKI